MRLEKGHRGWGADLTTERTPLEAGLDAFVKTEGRSFVRRDAMIERQEASPWRMTLVEIEDDGERLPFYAHGVWQQDRPVGVVTSGAYGSRTGKLLALAYLCPGTATRPLTVSLLGRRARAFELAQPPYDQQNLRQRASSSA